MRSRTQARRSSNTITIVQPYVPSYRVPLFDRLHALLATDGLELVVAHPTQPAGQDSRSDARIGKWSQPLRDRTVRAGRQTLHFRMTAPLARRSRLIVAELASTNLDTYLLTLHQRTPLILWGHGRAYVTDRNALDEALEIWLARRAAHLLLYTVGGAEFLTDHGIRPDRMTVVENSTDTVALRGLMAAITPEQLVQFRTESKLGSSNVAAYIGTLNSSKRLDLLLDASSAIRAQLPDFQLVIVGDGPLRAYVQGRAARQPEVRFLSYADPQMLALVGAVSQLCLLPGRVGLVAVDAMTLGLPVVTTDWGYHAPERDYLLDAFTVTTRENSQAFAASVLTLLQDPLWRETASVAAKAASLPLSIENTASRMHDAILQTI